MNSPTNTDSTLPVLEITSMAYGGKGVARLDGKVYFVGDTVEGDIVRARITEDKERYCNAEVAEVITPSPMRTPPRCRFIDSCGGCQWMGISYDQQLEWKKQFILSSLKRIGKIPDDREVSVRPSPDVYKYRNRVLIRVHVSPTGQLTCGYFSRGSRNLVAIDRCEIACEPINQLISALPGVISDMDFTAGWVKFRLEIQELPHGSGRIVASVYPGEGDRKKSKEIAEKLQHLEFVTWAGMVFDQTEAKETEFDRQFDRTFLTIPGQFQQVNVAHNQNLRQYIFDLVEAKNPKRILDVFCGSGNLSIGLADGKRYIEGVEANKVAIDCAKKNVADNQLVQMTYIAGDAEKHLKRSVKNKDRFDLVILDPPRQGFYAGMPALMEIKPKNIIYVSCDPTTLARDVGVLCRDHTYVIESITGFDFFPNTYHVETVISLRLS